jgi:transposase
MTRATVLQEVRRMRFEERYTRRQRRELTMTEAAEMLGITERTFRRWSDRYEAEGAAGLADRRLGRASARAAPVDEVLQMVTLYETRCTGWTVKHFHERWHEDHGGTRSYTWTKNRLQRAGPVMRAPRRGAHRKKRPRKPLPGMMLHQDGSTHEWVSGCQWDLIVTMDDATSELSSAFFVEEEGTMSSFQGLREVIERKGLFSSLYTDRGTHYWHTKEVGGKVDTSRLTQVHRALRQLGITLIPAYSPEARGRSERVFRTLQDRLPKELAFCKPTLHLAHESPFIDITVRDYYNGDTCLISLNDRFIPLVFGQATQVRLKGISIWRSKVGVRRRRLLPGTLGISSKQTSKGYPSGSCGPQRDKYFRLLGYLVVDGENMSDSLLKAGHAHAYSGGTKPPPPCPM